MRCRKQQLEEIAEARQMSCWRPEFQEKKNGKGISQTDREQ